MTIVIVVALGGAFAVMWRAIPKDPAYEPAIFGRLFGEGRAIHALTVFLVVAAAFYLAEDGNKLSPQVSTLLSGIAGFAFGAMSARPQRSKQTKAEQDATKAKQDANERNSKSGA